MAVEFFNMKNCGNTADHVSGGLTQNNCRGLTRDPWDNANVWRISQAFKAFVWFCRNLAVAMIFLKGNQAYADRTRSWFKLVDSPFDLHLYASAAWSYIAPKWR